MLLTEYGYFLIVVRNLLLVVGSDLIGQTNELKKTLSPQTIPEIGVSK